MESILISKVTFLGNYEAVMDYDSSIVRKTPGPSVSVMFYSIFFYESIYLYYSFSGLY